MTLREKAHQMRYFLNEHYMATGRQSFVDLPDPGQLQARTITIPREQVIAFRNSYRLLLEFAVLMCGKPGKELCTFDLMAPVFAALQEED